MKGKFITTQIRIICAGSNQHRNFHVTGTEKKEYRLSVEKSIQHGITVISQNRAA